MRIPQYVLPILALTCLWSCSTGPADESTEPEQEAPAADQGRDADPDPDPAPELVVIDADDGVGRVELSDDEWRERLTEDQFYVLRKKGTEQPGTGHLLKSKTAGTYVCAACRLPLFASSTKFDSGTGWPSFYAPIKDGHIAEESDRSLGAPRTEVLCARCDGHLGHVFPDGPKPTGLRYCINSVSLALEPADQ